jgi:sarcosine oxidase subunit beta
MQTIVEVLIAGGGVIGSSIAYHVARQGRSVLVAERGAVATEPAASWASAGGIRRQDQDPAEAALAVEAIARWPALADELEADLRYRQRGHLLLAESDAEAQQLQSFVRRQHELGFADVALVDRQQAFSLAPGLGEQVTAGSFSPADGQADPVLVTRAFAGAAQRHGARYWTGVECQSLLRVANRVVGVQTARGDVSAQHVVLAAGAWSRELALTAGVELPLRPRVLQVLRSASAAPGSLAPVLGAVSRALWLKQLDDGAFLLGGGWLGDLAEDGRSYSLRPAGQQGNWQTACELFPPVRAQRLERAWGGVQAQTIDDLPLLGGFVGLEGLTLALGSWHGFGLAPAIGRCIADLLAGLPTPALDRLAPDRIAQFDAAQVAAFLAGPRASEEVA